MLQKSVSQPLFHGETPKIFFRIPRGNLRMEKFACKVLLIVGSFSEVTGNAT